MREELSGGEDKKMKADERAKIIEQLIRKEWESLESHLKFMYTKSKDGKVFDKRCVRDYAIQIYKLSKLL